MTGQAGGQALPHCGTIWALKIHGLTVIRPPPCVFLFLSSVLSFSGAAQGPLSGISPIPHLKAGKRAHSDIVLNGEAG